MSVSDRREFIRLDVGYFDNPKVGEALDVSHAAVVLHIESMMYARRHRTDGIVPAKRVMRKVGATEGDAQTLLDAGLWHQLDSGRIEVHDYAKHQETREEIEARSAAAKKAIRTRWDREKGTGRTTARSSDGTATGSTAGNTEERRGEESNQHARTEADEAAPKPEKSNPNAVLLALGLSEDERREFNNHLREAGARSPSAVVLSLDASGQLADRVREWRDMKTAAEKPRPGTAFWGKRVGKGAGA